MSKYFNIPFCILLCFSLTATAQDFYVSPSGNDQADGLSPVALTQTNGPFQTPERAKHAVRELKTNSQFKEQVKIHIAAGTYQLQKPLEFDERDTGFAGREIIWQGEKAATIISGGLDLTNCSPTENHIWSCSLAGLNLPYNLTPEKYIRFPGFNLFVNDNRFHLARWPDNEWAHIKTPLDDKTNFTSFETIPAVSFPANTAQVHIFPNSDWFEEYLPLESIDSANQAIKLAKKTSSNLATGRRYYLQNIQAELNVPEEWYFDQANSKILFIPHHDKKPEKIVLSASKHLINLDGAHHIHFQDLSFRHSVDTAINLKNASDILLDNLEINNVDTNAIQAENSYRITVSNSQIHDTGEAGILMNGGDRTTLKTSNNVIHNNHIHHTGIIKLTFSVAIDAGGVGCQVTHNQVEHTSGTGISMNGNEHLFEKNEISYACEQESDCGAIYMGRNWTWRGNVIRYNHIHDIYGYGLQSVDAANNIVKYGSPSGSRGVYLDDAMSGYTIEGNIFNKAGTMEIQLGGGRDNIISNNVFLNAMDCAICVDARWKDFEWETLRKSLADSPYLSPAWKAKYPELSQPMLHDTWPEGNVIRNNVIISARDDGRALQYNIPTKGNTISNNLVWGLKGKFNVDYNFIDQIDQHGTVSLQDWMKLGVEHNSIEADPCVNLSGNKLSFCKDSPVQKIGFKALPKDIGLIR